MTEAEYRDRSPEEQERFMRTVLPILDQLWTLLQEAGFAPGALIEVSAMLLVIHAGVRDWQHAGAPPGVEIAGGSKESVREALGALAGLLRTSRAM